MHGPWIDCRVFGDVLFLISRIFSCWMQHVQRGVRVHRLKAVIYAVIHPISTVERNCHVAYNELKATCMFVLKGAQQRMRWVDKGHSFTPR